MLVYWLTPRTWVWISSPLPCVWIYISTYPHSYIQGHCFYFYTSLWRVVRNCHFSQIFCSVNIQNFPKALKGEVFDDCYTHVHINKSKTTLHSSVEAGIAVCTGSCLVSLPALPFPCCLESWAERLLKAKSLLLACYSFSFFFSPFYLNVLKLLHRSSY